MAVNFQFKEMLMNGDPLEMTNNWDHLNQFTHY